MKTTLTVILGVLLAVFCSSSKPDLLKPQGTISDSESISTNVTPESPFDISPDESAKITNIAYERLLRQVVPIDSTALLADKTTRLQFSEALPESISSALLDSFNEANKDTDSVFGSYDVYAKLIRVSVTGDPVEFVRDYGRTHPDIKSLVQLSGVGISYTSFGGTQFKRNPREMFACARISINSDSQSKVVCLLTTYDSNSNKFEDYIYERNHEGQWLLRLDT